MRKTLFIITVGLVMLTMLVFTGSKPISINLNLFHINKIKCCIKNKRLKFSLNISEKKVYINSDNNEPNNDLLDDQDNPDVDSSLAYIMCIDYTKQAIILKTYIRNLISFFMKYRIRRC